MGATIVPFYSGESDKRSFSELISELQLLAASPGSCIVGSSSPSVSFQQIPQSAAGVLQLDPDPTCLDEPVVALQGWRPLPGRLSLDESQNIVNNGVHEDQLRSGQLSLNESQNNVNHSVHKDKRG